MFLLFVSYKSFPDSIFNHEIFVTLLLTCHSLCVTHIVVRVHPARESSPLLLNLPPLHKAPEIRMPTILARDNIFILLICSFHSLSLISLLPAGEDSLYPCPIIGFVRLVHESCIIEVDIRRIKRLVFKGILWKHELYRPDNPEPLELLPILLSLFRESSPSNEGLEECLLLPILHTLDQQGPPLNPIVEPIDPMLQNILFSDEGLFL